MNMMTIRLAAWIALTVALPAQGRGQANDKTQANAYDDAWEDGWVAHSRAIYRLEGKTPGMTLQLGDSITHANPYTQWPRRGQGKTAEDKSIAEWCGAENPWPPSSRDATQENGWYLAAADTSGLRGMTAAGGLRVDELLSGDGNGGATMPQASENAEARDLVADGDVYPGNLQIHTVAKAFSRAQFAVVLLGTNDASAGRTPSRFIADLKTVVEVLEERNIVVILSTLPPHPGAGPLVEVYNDEVRGLARSHGLPLIDFHAEILSRRPGTSWNGTLLGAGDIHPSASSGGFNSASDPYTPGGDPEKHATGEACLHVGYLLRSWLTLQKLKEVKSLVGDPPVAMAIPGDCDSDGALRLSDAICLLSHLFLGEPEDLPCEGGRDDDAANLALLDANGDGGVDLADAVYLLFFLFLGTPAHVGGVECREMAQCPSHCASP